jgi:hypothetical protein
MNKYQAQGILACNVAKVLEVEIKIERIGEAERKGDEGDRVCFKIGKSKSLGEIVDD